MAYPGTAWEPKQAFRAVANFYAATHSEGRADNTRAARHIPVKIGVDAPSYNR
jgi:hypothetical protein